MNCPRCSHALESAALRELGLIHNVHRCAGCRGIWVGPQEMTDISMTVDQRWFEFRHIPSAAEQRTPMQCPACAGGVVMQKVESSRDTKVVMDVCPTCKHVWLDGGEHEAIERDSLLALLRDYFAPRPGSGS